MMKNVDAGVNALRADLDSGRWEEKYGDLLALDAYDFGYRLLRTEKT